EYDFLEKIGDGAFGQVYRAQHKITHQIVAIKTVKHRPADHVDDATDYSLREYRALRMLDCHPNIVQLYQSFIASADELHLVMEYVNGGNLLQYMQHRRDLNIPLEHSEIRRIFRQVMQALEHIHRQNIFHRDLKPENILIANMSGETSTSVIKLADFGLARRMDGKGPLTEYISTRWYRAPEVLLRSRHYSSPVDIWAAGTILAELTTLSPLFPGNTQIDQIYRICSVLGNNKWREGLKLAQRMGFQFPNASSSTLQAVVPTASPSMLDLLRKLLYYDPQRRLTATEALQHPFF
ncbi:kinase-like domain-containing protein, partial [Dichotomocladium elegans]